VGKGRVSHRDENRFIKEKRAKEKKAHPPSGPDAAPHVSIDPRFQLHTYRLFSHPIGGS
jgi:hypothetical protein